MATKNYTTKTASLKATTADIRKLDATSVSAATVDADKLVADNIAIVEDGKEVDLVQKMNTIASSIKTGVDIGTKDDSFDNDEDTAGFLKSVSKLNFKGAFVNVIKKDDGTVDLWINPDNNLGKIDAASSSFTAPSGSASKYVFGGDDYTLPGNSGASFARCHAVDKDPTVTLNGKKEGTVNSPFSIGNITSQIKAVVYDKAGTAKATCTTAVLKSGAATKTENNIKITIGSLYEYTEADAERGFVPGTVSLSCSVTPDISAIFGEGDTWSMKVFLVNGDSEEELYSSSTYYAYTTKAATISAAPTIKLNGDATTRWVSGVEYIAKGTKFDVTYGDMSNTTYMIAANATKRGTIALTSCGSSDISGATSDTCSTVISGTTKTFTLGDDTTAKTSLTATHTAISAGGDASKTNTYSGAIWSTGTEDTYNTAYFEREDSPNNGYGRIVGHIDGGTLVIDSETFDSTKALSGNTGDDAIYNNQAKVYNGTLVYGSGSGNKYYVRKFKKSTSSTAGLMSMTLTAPGRTMNGANMEIWYYPASNLTFARRIDATSPNGIGVASGTNDIKVTVPTTVALQEKDEFYIVVVLKNTSGKITADMKVS
jgi:hypothetical protein